MTYKNLIKINFLLFISCFLSIYNLLGQEIPGGVIPVCSNQDIVAEPPTITSFNNIRTSCESQALSNKLGFYLIQIKSGTTFTFEIVPENNVDFDFASWKNPNLTDFPNNLGNADRGSQNNPHSSLVYT